MPRLRLIFVLVATAILLIACSKPGPGSDNSQTISGLPWQIKTYDDGSSEVFGLRIGHTSLAQATELIKADHQAAIIIDQQNSRGLEMYFNQFKAGVLDGKLVIVADITDAELEQMIANLDQGDYMASGARKLIPTDADWNTAEQAVISSIAFIPAINLDEDIILNRFGQQPEIVLTPGLKHFLYAKQGLDIALSNEGKEVLQYVAPKAFQQLRQPLIYAAQFAAQVEQ